MFVTIRSVAALAMLVLLSGCYESRTPLLAPTEADYPFNARVDYTRTDSAGVQTQGSLQPQDGIYVRSESGMDTDTHVLFQHLHDDYYLVQESSATTGGSNYDLVRITADIVYLYNLRCGNVADAPAIATGAVTAVDDQFGGLTCTATSLDTVRELIEAKIDGAAPVEQFQILGVRP